MPLAIISYRPVLLSPYRFFTSAKRTSGAVGGNAAHGCLIVDIEYLPVLIFESEEPDTDVCDGAMVYIWGIIVFDEIAAILLCSHLAIYSMRNISGSPAGASRR